MQKKSGLRSTLHELEAGHLAVSILDLIEGQEWSLSIPATLERPRPLCHFRTRLRWQIGVGSNYWTGLPSGNGLAYSKAAYIHLKVDGEANGRL